jgi:hypothetical protein
MSTETLDQRIARLRKERGLPESEDDDDHTDLSLPIGDDDLEYIAALYQRAGLPENDDKMGLVSGAGDCEQIGKWLQELLTRRAQEKH